MSDAAPIPDDVKRAAKAAHAEYADSRCRDNLGVIIARAILAERERCATIAEARGWGGEVSAKIMSSWPLYEQGEKFMADEIAGAIRKGETTHD